jgi:hypothetical protein
MTYADLAEDHELSTRDAFGEYHRDKPIHLHAQLPMMAAQPHRKIMAVPDWEPISSSDETSHYLLDIIHIFWYYILATRYV